MLNFLYSVLEVEVRIAINALGLDPGMGLLHVDTASRDSLVYDLMEPLRPEVDLFLLDWMQTKPLNRSWFAESHEGQCHLSSDLISQLVLTSNQWRMSVAKIAEWFVKQLCLHLDMSKMRRPGTRLTQERRREAVGKTIPDSPPKTIQQNLCQDCGALVSATSRRCLTCVAEFRRQFLLEKQKAGLSQEAKAKRSESLRRQRCQQLNWSPSELPEWITDEVYLTRIQPLLKTLPRKATAEALGVSAAYIRAIIAGKHIPHKRHWVKLAGLVGVGKH